MKRRDNENKRQRLSMTRRSLWLNYLFFLWIVQYWKGECCFVNDNLYPEQRKTLLVFGRWIINGLFAIACGIIEWDAGCIYNQMTFSAAFGKQKKKRRMPHYNQVRERERTWPIRSSPAGWTRQQSHWPSPFMLHISSSCCSSSQFNFLYAAVRHSAVSNKIEESRT